MSAMNPIDRSKRSSHVAGESTTRPEALRLDIWHHSESGGRSWNQDHVGYVRLADDRGAWVALADGLGSHRGSGQAAEVAVNAALHRSMQSGADLTSSTVESVMEAAHQAVVRAARSADHEARGMRTTLVILGVHQRAAIWGHVGDSRLYHIRDHRVVERTLDDSVVEVLYRDGQISEEEMGSHPDRNQLLRTLSGEESFRARVRDSVVELQAGDRFFLCTDGAWERLPTRDIERLSRRCHSAGEFGEALMAEVFSDGSEGRDNVSLAVVELEVSRDSDGPGRQGVI